MSSEKPDQIQASVAAALSRLRGDLGPSGATAPRLDEPPQGDRSLGDRGAVERARPANDVRGDPFFKSIQSPPPGAGMAGPGRAPIPMTPFLRMQAPQEPASSLTSSPMSSGEPPADEPRVDEGRATAEPTSSIEIPPMPKRIPAPDVVPMPEASAMSSEPPEPSLTASAAPQPTAAPQLQAAPASPLSRVMRGAGPAGLPDPAQRDLLAGLPPPPISEPLTADTESSAMRRRRRNRRMLAAAAVIVVVAIGAWLWTSGEPSTEVPVVAAETTPEKVKPADEGGLQVQNQDVQVLDPTQPQGETVMPEPEQPMTPPAPSAEQAPIVVENTAPDAGVTSEAPAIDTPPAPDVPLAATPLPSMGESETVESSAAASPSPQTEPAAPAPAPAAEQPAQTAEAPAATEPAPAQAAPAPAATEPAPAQATAPEPAATEAPTQEAAVAPIAPAGNTRVQLAAGKSEASVQKEWAALQKAHPGLLGALSLTIERVDKGASGVFYRLQAGPLADKTAAKELCASLKQKGQDCIVVSK